MEIQEKGHKNAANATQVLTAQVLSYITMNRLNNVISKQGKISNTKSQHAKLLELLVKDALQSFREENSNPKILTQIQSNKEVMEKVNAAANKVINAYFGEWYIDISYWFFPAQKNSSFPILINQVYWNACSSALVNSSGVWRVVVAFLVSLHSVGNSISVTRNPIVHSKSAKSCK